MSEKSGRDLSKIPIILADVNDPESLIRMTSKTRLIMNAVGPYIFFGEQVILACIEEGCHYVDVTAEPQFMELMQLKYHEAAKDKGVFLVSACGFDSIPADIGTLFMEKQFNGCVNSVEIYMRIFTEKQYLFAPVMNYGSWESIILIMSNAKQLGTIRKKIYPNGFPKFNPKLKRRFLFHKPSFMNHVCINYPGIDRSVVTRSQRFLYNRNKKRPIQVKAYFAINSIVQMFAGAFVGPLFLLLSQFSFGRYLLKRFNKIISLGLISKEGPTDEEMKNVKFEFTFNGEGWKEPRDQYINSMDKKIVTRVNSDYSGYEITCIAFLSAAKTILTETERMPGNGGVLSPGAAFYDTNLIETLKENGLKFEVLEETL